MTENQELQVFDETLREFLTEPDHFLTSLALVNLLTQSTFQRIKQAADGHLPAL